MTILLCFRKNNNIWPSESKRLLLNFRDGLLRETLIRSCRQFANNIERGLNLTDPESVFLLLPGQTEPEDETGNV